MKSSFRTAFFSLETGNQISWHFWRFRREATGGGGKIQLSLALFFLEKVERSQFHPNMEWKTVSQLEHIPGMGINCFLLISIHGSSFFLFTAMDFIL